MKIKRESIKTGTFKNIYSDFILKKKTTKKTAASTTIKELSVPPPFLRWVVVTWCLCAKLAAVMLVWVCCGPQMRKEASAVVRLEGCSRRAKSSLVRRRFHFRQSRTQKLGPSMLAEGEGFVHVSRVDAHVHVL